MSQEDKLKEAKRLYETANADQRYVLERLFPGLKESEDERTRQEIVRFIRMEVEDEIVGNKWLAWLEKQGADKPYYTELLGYFEDGKRLSHSVGEIIDWLKSKI